MHVHFDCFSGISGDMTLGAFVDLGVPVSLLKEKITAIPLEGFDITSETVVRNGITATNLHVHIDKSVHPRDYAGIKTLIGESTLSESVKTLSMDIFERIAVAESKIHGCPKEKVHFHEVGAVDAVVDIVGTALCVDYLGIRRVTASRIALGSGFARCDHGRLPVPVPAVLEILKGVPVYGAGIDKELVTPTGAAIITALAESFGNLPEMVIEKTGYGSGKRVHKETPNLLRVIAGPVGEDSSHIKKDRVCVVETAIDDMNPEMFGAVMERLFSDGALDVCLIPVMMKKNRPGTKLQVICPVGLKDRIARRVLKETTSLGVRHYEAERSILARRIVEVDTPFGRIKAKEVTDPDGVKRIVPEYDVAREIALREDIPVKQVYDGIIASVS